MTPKADKNSSSTTSTLSSSGDAEIPRLQGHVENAADARTSPSRGFYKGRASSFPELSDPRPYEKGPSLHPRHPSQLPPPTSRIITMIRYTFLLLALISIVNSVPLSLVTRQLGFPATTNWYNSSDWSSPSSISSYDADTWTLSTSSLVQNAYQNQPYVANGYHGARLTAEGLGYWQIRNYTENGTQPVNGWPLDNARQTFSTISGFWDSQRNISRTNFKELLDKGGESVISGIPTWTSFIVHTTDGEYYAAGVDNTTVSNYKQTLSLKNGIVTTSLTWTPNEDEAYDLVFTVLAHRERITLGMMKIEITPHQDGQFGITDVLDGAGAQRTNVQDKQVDDFEEVIWTAVEPVGLDQVWAHEVSVVDFASSAPFVVQGSRKAADDRAWVSKNESTIAQEWLIDGRAEEPLTIYKYVGIASTDAFPDSMATARSSALKAKEIGWDELVLEHSNAWGELWSSADIELPNSAGTELEDFQTAFRASLFHLLANVRSGKEGAGIGDNSISVGGLSSDSYAGLVFWDADLWMMPGLLALYPDLAASISNYRSRLLPQAKENAKEYGYEGAMYPWTSSRFGNCTSTGPCKDYQYHLNSDIALVNWHQFLTTGDTTWLRSQGFPIISNVANMFSSLVVRSNSSGADGLKEGMFTIRNMTDPDEYANHVDSGAYTNVGARTALEIALQASSILNYTTPPEWQEIHDNIFIPYHVSAGIIPEFAGMNGSVEIKQADVVLLNYPMRFRINESQANNDLDFYARAQSEDGPAMTWAMFAVNAAELSPHGCAQWTYALTASQPYLRAPWWQFSEQIIDDVEINGGTNPAFTFLTGAGGFLQVATHGYTGYRPTLDSLYLDPSLPPQLTTGINIPALHHANAVFSINITLTSTSVYRHPDPISNSTNYYSPSAPIKIDHAGQSTYDISPGQTIILETRRPDLNGTDIPGNLAECKLAYSPAKHAPGKFPVGGVDGSNHTSWRPLTADNSSLIVDVGAPITASKIHINWGSWPPLAFRVYSALTAPVSAAVALGGKLDGDVGEGWELVHEATEVELSEPWKKEDALEVKMVKGNQSEVDLEEQKVGRWWRLEVEGDREGTGRGGTVAQFAVL